MEFQPEDLPRLVHDYFLDLKHDTTVTARIPAALRRMVDGVIASSERYRDRRDKNNPMGYPSFTEALMEALTMWSEVHIHEDMKEAMQLDDILSVNEMMGRERRWEKMMGEMTGMTIPENRRQNIIRQLEFIIQHSFSEDNIRRAERLLDDFKQ